MSHVTEVVKYEKLSNGQFTVVIRCCGNASTDWPHTMAAQVAADPERKAVSLGEARKACAELHQHALDAESQLVGEMGKTVDHA